MLSPDFDAQLLIDLKKHEHTCWDVLNEELCALCVRYPGHIDDQAIVAKLQIIGKTYGAPIDRKSRIKNADELYCRRVAPALRNSRIDMLMNRLAGLEPWSAETLTCLAECHIEIIHAVQNGTGRDNRSFASKYLHFHCPRHALIYDSHSRSALGLYKRCGMLSGGFLEGFDWSEVRRDKEYSKHLIDAYHLQEQMFRVIGKRVSPRHFDNILLYGQFGVRRAS